MFNFELTSRENKENIPQHNPENNKGLEGACVTCHGEGQVPHGFLKPKKVCGECHGKGFVKPSAEPERKYDWETGTVH
ncbi:hypothetical protein AUJ77_02025 [Candidatus Nomurabacteria bacterium CG1_02_43_90]|uniref:Cytochrome c7-like domain-containing protein n=1 Tax=Candidatus Nomurabacteria bacterium CG1_02_43_90 TaxID=1805281 RepID=A0A1J4V8H3_9BACT|nr:MAG: hypothetical protein AUJ77_02025 [Candidatus Nomurabacteria bacterium CG1_02_43_90]